MTDSGLSEMREEHEQIEKFTEAVLRQKSGNYPSLNMSSDGHVFPPTEGVTTNRGNKLLQGSEGISRTFLNNSIEIKEEKIFYNGSEHKLLGRKPRAYNTSSDDWNDDKEMDLNTLVDVRRTLTPVASLEDVVNHPAVSRTYSNVVLKELALQAVLMIEKEQVNVISYSKLLEVFLGDHPGPIREDTLQLEPYDHNLRIIEDTEESTPTQNMKQANVRTSINSDADDPFFALPNFNPANTLPSLIDQDKPNLSDEVEATRQLAQIALQRNQEFIRNLRKIRNCVVKANRIRERILTWGKEYAGVSEDDVTVPSALHIVKRGLISATTNRTMTNEEPEEEELEE